MRAKTNLPLEALNNDLFDVHVCGSSRAADMMMVEGYQGRGEGENLDSRQKGLAFASTNWMAAGWWYKYGTGTVREYSESQTRRVRLALRVELSRRRADYGDYGDHKR